jgi:hypothetical protein
MEPLKEVIELILAKLKIQIDFYIFLNNRLIFLANIMNLQDEANTHQAKDHNIFVQ